mgnify:CR=1 FL=1
MTSLTERIYRIRYALVHKKEEIIDNMYDPYNEKRIESLKNEIPIIKAIAKNLIISKSKERQKI